MADSKHAVVITTINQPTRAVEEIARDCARLSAEFVIIGDTKSPVDFHQDGANYLDVLAQMESGFALGKIAPTKHYARKNIGYLEAIRNGAEIILETDDDNIPLVGFWAPRHVATSARHVESAGWTNVYRYFSKNNIWPRGLPLDKILTPPPSLDGIATALVQCPIQQGLANKNPDVDAIYRLVLPLPIDFDEAPPVALGRGSWCPFNSQNTTWWREAFPLLYLPFHCSFRMTDIWRSFVAQRISWENGWSVLFHSATVFQERNEHSLIRDFEEEIPGYLRNTAICEQLGALSLRSGVAAIPDNLRLCYRELVANDHVGSEELPLLDAWLDDLAALGG